MKVPGKIIIPSLLLLCLWLSHASALEVPEYPKGRITDFTHTLSPNEISHLDKKLADFEKQTTNQIAVVMIPSLEGDNLEDYSIRLADKWKIGQKGKDNGVILLIVKNDRKLRIEVGYGLEGVLPDGLAGSIIRNKIAPYFKKQQFFHGINHGTTAIIEAISPSFRPTKPKVKKTSQLPFTPIILIGIFIFVFPIFLFLYMLYLDSKHKKETGHRVFFGGVGPSGGFGGGGGGFSGGGGGFGGGGASGGW